MKIIFSEKQRRGAINHPENSKTPANQLKWVIDNVTKETVNEMIVVTCSPYILQACIHMVKKFNALDHYSLFDEKKPRTGKESLVFNKMAEPMRQVIFNEI